MSVENPLRGNTCLTRYANGPSARVPLVALSVSSSWKASGWNDSVFFAIKNNRRGCLCSYGNTGLEREDVYHDSGQKAPVIKPPTCAEIGRLFGRYSATPLIPSFCFNRM